MMEIERGGTVEVTGFYIDHEYEDPAIPETWIEKGKR